MDEARLGHGNGRAEGPGPSADPLRVPHGLPLSGVRLRTVPIRDSLLRRVLIRSVCKRV